MDHGPYRIAIVGSGPAGLTAGAHAARLGVSHVVLEKAPQIASTVFGYQKGKHVMAEPSGLPLQAACPLRFEAGSREAVLTAWEAGVRELGVTVRHGAEVAAVRKGDDGFSLTLGDGDTLRAEHVVLALGMSRPRSLGIPGENLPFVQYTLVDPDAYEGEEIVVVGAGDSAIENALALAAGNDVCLVNRGDEFNRAKEANARAVLQHIEEGRVGCFYNASPVRVEPLPDGSAHRGRLVLATAEGEAEVPCDRIIVRIGAVAPRRFVESCGVVYPGADALYPELSDRYETNVPGLYIVGALGGYPLIKQCMNQGHEVVAHILGEPVEAADEPLLRQRFRPIPGRPDVATALELIRARVPLLSGLTTLQLRELMLDSRIRAPARREVLFRRDDFSTSFFCILDGEVVVELHPNGRDGHAVLGRGRFFGEMSLISGRRRSATLRAGAGCILIEIPRRAMLRLISSVQSVRDEIDRAFVVRTLQTRFATSTPIDRLIEVAAQARLRRFDAGETLFSEGDEAHSLHVIRRGSVTVSRRIGEHEAVLTYLPSGSYVGEMGIMGRSARSATVRAAIGTETIELTAESFQNLLEADPQLKARVQEEFRRRLAMNARMLRQPEGGSVISFLVSQGVGEATDVLLIDPTLCVHCDNCETACAETHGGTSRLDREAGPSIATVQVPTSCRHCEHPHCMKDCPPDAIHRAPGGEVYIADNCIGCGNCEQNCPYGVIRMAAPAPARSGLLGWMLFGAGPGPGEREASAGADPHAPKTAVKCDMCKDLSGGPACVRSCPTGAALRIGPEELPAYVGTDARAHASLLTFRKSRYLWWALALSAASLAACAGQQAFGTAATRPWYGYGLGGVGGLLIVWLTAFGIRKRRYRSTVGSVGGWLSAHVYLGGSLLVVGTVHSGLRLGWNVHTLAWGLTVTVIASGMYGVFAYLRYPERIARNRDHMTRDDMWRQLEEIDQQCLALSVDTDAGTHDLVLAGVQDHPVRGGILRQVAGGAARDRALSRATEHVMARLSSREDAEEAARLRTLMDLLHRKAALLDRLRRDIRFKARMDAWRLLHIPATFALLGALIAHVVSVLAYR